MASPGLADEPFLLDAEPVVELVGERQRGRRAVREGGRIGRRYSANKKSKNRFRLAIKRQKKPVILIGRLVVFFWLT